MMIKFLTIISLVFVFSFNMKAQYPAVSGSDGTSIYIDRVEFNTINNTSGGGGTGYEDFSNISTTVSLDSTYTLTAAVKRAPGQQNIDAKAWFDWNNNGNFNDTGEEYGFILDNSKKILTASITIPSDASQTNIRLRISYSDGDIALNSGTYTLGESEDYTIVIDGGDQNPLPIELINFDTKANKNIVEIIWATASELNNDYFEVQKSNDGLNFETTETIDGAGNSNTIIDYQTVDNNPISGISYYRIKQTDFDGSFSFSDIKAVNFTQEINLEIFPNPASEILNIQSNSAGIIEIRNQNGSLVYKAEVQVSNSKININKLASGIYILRFISNENIEVVKFIKR